MQFLHTNCSVFFHPDVQSIKWERGELEEIPLPSPESFNTLLNDCQKKKTLFKTKQIHNHLAFFGLDSVTSFNVKLVTTFASCGDIEDAFRVFNQSPSQHLFSWAYLISGFVDCGDGKKALELYGSMKERGLKPSPQTIVSLLRACGDICAIAKGIEIHNYAKKEGFEDNFFIVSALIMMYGKCGHVVEAEDVFIRLAQYDLVSWNAMLSMYVEIGEEGKALSLFEKILETQMSPNERTMVCVIQAISLHIIEGESRMLQERQSKAYELHSHVVKKGFDDNIYIYSALLGMYGKIGTIMDTEHMFVRYHFLHDIVPWNVMLSVYVDRGYGEKALRLFRQMQQEEVPPNETSFMMALQACCLMADEERMNSVFVEIGLALHSDARRNGFERDTLVCTMLINMYAKYGRILEAEHLFEAHSHHDIVSWTIMLSVYVEFGQGEKALQLYKKMIGERMDPNECTFVFTFQACGLLAEKEEALATTGMEKVKVKSLEIGQALLIDAREKGCDREPLTIANIVIMYGKCGGVMEAKSMFLTHFPIHTDTILFNALLLVYIENGHDRQALEMFQKILDGGGTPICLNTTTFLYILQACTRSGSSELCQYVHFIIISGGLDSDLLLSTKLIHAYGSFGSVDDAKLVFDSIPKPDIASWNSLISGYARRGNLDTSARLFGEIQLARIKPNEITYLLLLSICSHVGHVQKGLEFFHSIDRDNALCMEREHFVSIEDLVGRAGNLSGVLYVLSKIPIDSYPIPWSCVLTTCLRHGNGELGKFAFDHAICMDTIESNSAYISMSNIYANGEVVDL